MLTGLKRLPTDQKGSRAAQTEWRKQSSPWRGTLISASPQSDKSWHDANNERYGRSAKKLNGAAEKDVVEDVPEQAEPGQGPPIPSVQLQSRIAAQQQKKQGNETINQIAPCR